MILFVFMGGLTGMVLGMVVTALLLRWDTSTDADVHDPMLAPCPQWTFEFVDGPNAGESVIVCESMWRNPQPAILANGGRYVIVSHLSFPESGGVVLYGFRAEHEAAA